VEKVEVVFKWGSFLEEVGHSILFYWDFASGAGGDRTSLSIGERQGQVMDKARGDDRW
jgi:hypothetical protein